MTWGVNQCTAPVIHLVNNYAIWKPRVGIMYQFLCQNGTLWWKSRFLEEAWLQIGWQHRLQPIRSLVIKWPSTNKSPKNHVIKHKILLVTQTIGYERHHKVKTPYANVAPCPTPAASWPVPGGNMQPLSVHGGNQYDIFSTHANAYRVVCHLKYNISNGNIIADKVSIRPEVVTGTSVASNEKMFSVNIS